MLNIPTKSHLENVQLNVARGKDTKARRVTWRRKLLTTCETLEQRQKALEYFDNILDGKVYKFD